MPGEYLMWMLRKVLESHDLRGETSHGVSGLIQRAAHPYTRPGRHMCVNLGRGHVHVAEQVLERPDVHP